MGRRPSFTSTQQVYIAFLWCWGAALARMSQSNTANTSLIVTNSALTTSIGVVVAIVMWTVGTTLFFGLPDYYRQAPGFVPNFLSGIFRRKIVLWFFIMVVCPAHLISPASDSPAAPANLSPRQSKTASFRPRMAATGCTGGPRSTYRSGLLSSSSSSSSSSSGLLCSATPPSSARATRG